MVWCLDFHASYRCRHTGSCCRAGWTIPFEDGTVAARDARDACSFLDGSTGLCSIHRTHGIQALPVTCRMFPRIVLHDDRGTFISLSHFCPTAARLLFDAPGEAAVVEAPPALSAIGALDGLDARGVWPPLLRPRVLMDLDSYTVWERRAVSLLTQATPSPAGALDMLEEVTTRITRWRPGGALLQDVMQEAFALPDTAARQEAGASATDRAVKRWLAARLFGSWTAYQGDGLIATVRYLRTCLDLFTREVATDGNAFEAIRRSDVRILHTT